jgi:RimJ/RimL family protein N-acetyltransferase
LAPGHPSRVGSSVGHPPVSGDGATRANGHPSIGRARRCADAGRDPCRTVGGRGLGPDAIRTLATHLIDDRGHHRLTIDPAADNEAAIRAYTKVGFRPVGIMRAYQRMANGTWVDAPLMDLIAEELVR